MSRRRLVLFVTTELKGHDQPSAATATRWAIWPAPSCTGRRTPADRRAGGGAGRRISPLLAAEAGRPHVRAGTAHGRPPHRPVRPAPQGGGDRAGTVRSVDGRGGGGAGPPGGQPGRRGRSGHRAAQDRPGRKGEGRRVRRRGARRARGEQGGGRRPGRGGEDCLCRSAQARRRRGGGAGSQTRKDARDLARAWPGSDSSWCGSRTRPDPPSGGRRAGGGRHGVLVPPADRGQIVSRIDMHCGRWRRRWEGPLRRRGWRGARPGPVRRLSRSARPSCAPSWRHGKLPQRRRAFVGEKERTAARLEAERDRLKAEPLQIPRRALVHAQPGAHPQSPRIDREVLARNTELDRV